MAASELEEAAAVLRQGGLVAYPTETFFGLAADPRSKEAIARLCAIKSRSAAEGIPLIIAGGETLQLLGAEETPEAGAARAVLAERFWPGPLTMVLAVDRTRSPIAEGVFGPEGSLAVRISSHPTAQALAAALSLGTAPGGAITATSANPHGAPPPKTAAEVRVYFPDIYLLRGECFAATAPSTIVDTRKLPFTVLREGALRAAELAPFLHGGPRP